MYSYELCFTFAVSNLLNISQRLVYYQNSFQFLRIILALLSFAEKYRFTANKLSS